MRPSSLKPKLYVESLAEVVPNVFGPNVAAERAATRRAREPLRFNEHTYFQKFGWANAPATTGAIVPEGVERQPGYSWYNTLQPNKKSVTKRFPAGDPRRTEEAVNILVNPTYRSNSRATTAQASAGTLVDPPYGLRFPNLLAQTRKRTQNKRIVNASRFGIGNLAAEIEARRQRGEMALGEARAAAAALEAEVREPSGNAGGAGSARRHRRKTGRNVTRRRR